MSHFERICGTLLATCMMMAAGIAQIADAHAGVLTVLHSFTSPDGANPWADVLIDRHGNLFGTTYQGGDDGRGVVFKLNTEGKETVLYSFAGGSDGTNPITPVIRDHLGHLYGTDSYAGDFGGGTVFRLDRHGDESVVYAFNNDRIGYDPEAGLLIDAAGDFYGTTNTGGSGGKGTIYELTPQGTATRLHAFKGHDGANPIGDLIMDPSGNIYGTTYLGGASNLGTVFELSPDGTHRVLHSFAGGSDGANPVAGLVADRAGNLYGTAPSGGSYGLGVVFKVAPDGTETVLHSFAGGSDGAAPIAHLTKDKSAVLYGTTDKGGSAGCGTIFMITKRGQETTLYEFTGTTDGADLRAGLTIDKAGNLYGTAYAGGKGFGTVFKFSR